MKYIILLLFLISQLDFSTIAQNIVAPIKNDNGKWGLIGADDIQIAEPKYSDIEVLGNGKFQIAIGGKLKDGVLDGEKWGIIDDHGNIILKAEYDEIGDFINGAASITKDGKIGFINRDYKVISQPIYDFVGTMNSQGFVWVNTGGKPDSNRAGHITKGKYGILDISGTIIIPVSYSSIGYISENKFHHDQHKIYNAKNEFERLMLECGSHYALWARPIDQKPGSLIPEAIGFSFSNRANLTLNGIAGLDGKVLIKNDVYQRCAMPSEGLSLVLTKKNQIGYHDISANKLIQNSIIRSAFSYNGNMTIGVDSKNNWSFYDTDLTQVGQSYDWISPKIGSHYLVRKGGKMAMLNASDLTPIVSDMEYIFPLTNGIMAYKDSVSGLWGFLNGNGDIVLPARYAYAYSFNHGVACVKGEAGWGMVNSDLQEVIPMRWKSIIFPTIDKFDRVWVESDASTNRYKCWNTITKDFAFTDGFDDVWNYKTTGDKEYAIVMIGEKYGQIDKDGNIAIPVEYDSITIAEEALFYKNSHNIGRWQQIHSYRFNSIYKNKLKKYTINDTLPNENWDY